jgi:hypothetical protein
LVRRDLGAEAMLYDPSADKVVRLNRTARRIWELCDGRHDVAAIAATIGREFAAGAGADVDGDVRTVVGALAGAGLFKQEDVA